MPVRCSSCLLLSPRGKPRSPDALVSALWAQCPQPNPRPAHSLVGRCRCGARGAPSRSVPTQSVVQGFIEITSSSSSSHVWKLGIGPVRAAQGRSDPVGRLWVVSVCLLSTRGQNDRCAPRPSSLHPLSPVCPCCIPRSCAGRAGPGEVTRRRDRVTGGIDAGQHRVRPIPRREGRRPGPAVR